MSKVQLEELLDVCRQVLDSCKLAKGTITNGYTLVDGEWKAIYEDGKVIEDPSLAEELLPTADGFFFGGTNYDQYYYEDIEHTINILEKVLGETDFGTQAIFYRSSW